MSDWELVTVDPADWVATAQTYRDRGFEYLDFVSVRELESGPFVVSAHLVRLPDQAAGKVIRRLLIESEWPVEQAQQIDSLVPVFAGAKWHELEASELFGISFGHALPTSEPFISSQPALRRDFALEPRLEIEWPGTNEPGLAPDHPRRKRKRAVPGNPATWELDAQKPSEQEVRS